MFLEKSFNLIANIYSIRRNRETCSSHLRAFSRTAFPKNPGYFGKLARAAPGRCNRRYFGKIAAAHHFLEDFRNRFPKYSNFGKCCRRTGVQLSKRPGYFGKMVRALNEAVVSSRGIYLPVRVFACARNNCANSPRIRSHLPQATAFH